MNHMLGDSSKALNVTARRCLGLVVALLVAVAASPASAQVELIDGFGGAAGYGNAVARNDDGSFGPIDIRPAFSLGVNFYGRIHNQIWINNNGNVTFAGAVGTYTPAPFPVSANPMIAPFWGDVDTRGTAGVGAEENLAYWAVDGEDDRFIGTWYNVGYYSSHNDQLNSFQAVLINRYDTGLGNFDFEFRYNRCEWVTGDASGGVGGHGGTPAQMGYDAGDGETFWSHPASQTEDIVDLCTTSNVGIPGIWRFTVRGGAPNSCGDGILGAEEECDDGNTDGNDGCTSCLDYFDLDDDGFYGDLDCDDTNPDINPDAVDICDGLDNDCNEIADDGLSTDADGDGHFTEDSCGEPNDDCDDSDPDIYPGAEELCDGLDNDCDGEADDGLGTDDDGDGHYTPGSCRGPDDDCDDTDPTRYGGAAEICDGLDNNCDDVVPVTEDDGDGDGVLFCAGDCDDTRDTVYPGAPELCDGLNNDCDDSTDENVDGDGDGVTICDGDCDDTDEGISPNAVEICDEGVDNDCDPTTDELADTDDDGMSICDGDCDGSDPSVHPGAEELCDGLDTNCDGTTPADEADEDEDGQPICAGDCDDHDTTVGEGFPELCDGIDNDCDGDLTGEAEDADGDGLTPCEGDCDDTNGDSIPGASEICDGFDNDCDGVVPEGEVDGDGDGVLLCADDCDDTNGDVYPGAPELCDGLDNNCDGSIDEGVTTTYYADTDGDGFGDLATSIDACAAPEGYVETGDDCDDTSDAVHPGANEECDGFDTDCDGDLPDDESDGDGDGFLGCEDDCDDGNGDTHPGAPGQGVGVDNDCDGAIGPGEEDLSSGTGEEKGCDCRASGARWNFSSLLRLVLGFFL